ncbi:MAG: hypothetical protein GIX03_05155 [Candidatus Eremiobacteraeota bacterium]|nr:hypothetical protein [Candidatus Eremiobacteraeota bacterium]MBC5802385.1 hypothetical protein [Candidatus Eremiobacteraeota bacterium]MBC5820603.1 hypothetical protein [Candidatus Eremiobacteraeota bacterium]
MSATPRRFAFTLLALSAIALAAVNALGTASPAVALPIPSDLPSGQTPPPLTATATPSPSGQVVQWSGQILDDRGGFVFFTTGDGFRLAPAVKIDDAKSGGATTLAPVTRVYARAGFDTGNGAVVELALSKSPLPNAASYADIKKYAVALSPPKPNPDLLARGEGFSGRVVLVTFTVEVPPRTPFNDPVYLATDVSGWSATAIRMDRVDALHYRVSQNYASGTTFLYRYTRGSWRSSERNQAGQEPRPHKLVVPNVDVEPVRDTVYAWGDQDELAPDLGQTIPTPFNPIPFVTPPH